MASLTKKDGLKLLKDGKFTDFKIICEDHTFDVHQNIIAVKSPFFAACIESGFQESEKCAVTLEEVRKEVVAFAIVSIYAGELSPGLLVHVWPMLKTPMPSCNQLDTMNITLLLDLHEFSNRLMMPDLRQKTARIIQGGFQELRDLVIAKHIKEDAATFASVLDIIYRTTERDDKEIRLPVTRLCLSHQQDLMNTPSIVDVFNKHESIAWAVWGEDRISTAAAVKAALGDREPVKKRPRT